MRSSEDWRQGGEERGGEGSGRVIGFGPLARREVSGNCAREKRGGVELGE
jgi:hypothetical protein